MDYWSRVLMLGIYLCKRANMECLFPMVDEGMASGRLSTWEFPSVLWYCWLGDRKGIWSVKMWLLPKVLWVSAAYFTSRMLFLSPKVLFQIKWRLNQLYLIMYNTILQICVVAHIVRVHLLVKQSRKGGMPFWHTMNRSMCKNFANHFCTRCWLQVLYHHWAVWSVLALVICLPAKGLWMAIGSNMYEWKSIWCYVYHVIWGSAQFCWRTVSYVTWRGVCCV